MSMTPVSNNFALYIHSCFNNEVGTVAAILANTSAN
uniref:Uncharacterized protein n=1 Tax=Anguilla anguilla TaxID=7936 RepID=A0A0E9WRV9_ANGAN